MLAFKPSHAGDMDGSERSNGITCSGADAPEHLKPRDWCDRKEVW